LTGVADAKQKRAARVLARRALELNIRVVSLSELRLVSSSPARFYTFFLTPVLGNLGSFILHVVRRRRHNECCATIGQEERSRCTRKELHMGTTKRQDVCRVLFRLHLESQLMPPTAGVTVLECFTSEVVRVRACQRSSSISPSPRLRRHRSRCLTILVNTREGGMVRRTWALESDDASHFLICCWLLHVQIPLLS
jgi:hypothetical protein